MIDTAAFSALEILLMATVGTLSGGVVVLAKWFIDYLKRTNQERAEEIKASVTVQAELKGVITHNNYLVENLPDRVEERVKSALIDEKIQAALQQAKKK